MNKNGLLLAQAEAFGNAVRVCESVARDRREKAQLETEELKRCAHECFAEGAEECAMALKDETGKILSMIAKGAA